MGLVHAEITLINGEDLILCQKAYIGEEEIKQVTAKMPVDSGLHDGY